MTETVTFDRPSFLCDESAWVRRLDFAMHAETVATFRKRLAEWLPFFPDAAKQIDGIKTWGDYQEFRRGMQAEREKRFAGEEWCERFACILMPGNAIKATAMSERFQAPWGAALVRVAEIEQEGRTLSDQGASVEGQK